MSTRKTNPAPRMSGAGSDVIGACAQEGVAGVSPILENPDGSVQEAGGVIDGDGNSHAIGAGEWDLGLGDLAARRIDYASAAALVVRSKAFSEVGGFDERYRLAYFEDADLALALAHAGWELRLVPAVRVLHRRGGTAVGRRSLDLAVMNHALFVEKWASDLASRSRDIETAEARRALRDRHAALPDGM